MTTETNTINENYDTESYITTTDNPWNPQSNFDEWYKFDTDMGYFTPQRLAKTIEYLAKTLKTDDPELLTDMAMLEMVRIDPLKRYTIVHLKKRDPGNVKLTDDQKAELELVRILE